MKRRAFTPKQLEALDVLIRLYPRGVGIEDHEARVVFNSLVARDTGMVELVGWPDSPSGDAFVLTDDAAGALRAEAEEVAAAADMN
jgi:hypothetical protein